MNRIKKQEFKYRRDIALQSLACHNVLNKRVSNKLGIKYLQLSHQRFDSMEEFARRRMWALLKI